MEMKSLKLELLPDVRVFFVVIYSGWYRTAGADALMFLVRELEVCDAVNNKMLFMWAGTLRVL